MVTKLKKVILDMIFPPHCLSCNHLGRYLCGECERKIIRAKSLNCSICNKKTPGINLCIACQSKFKISGIISFGHYRDPVLKDVLHRYKYEGISAAGGELATLLAGAIKVAGISFDVVTYAPISRRRYNERGYNQAKIIAIEIGRQLAKPVYRGLVKTKHTESQVGLRRKDRLSNLRGAFEAKDTTQISGKNVLIVDDVLTTGATLGGCAATLKQAGAKKIWGAVLAKE